VCLSQVVVSPFHPRRGPAGFTLAELLVVIAIIGVLIGLSLPAVQMAREAANRNSCQNNLRRIVLACHHAAENHNNYLPPGIGWYPAGGKPGDGAYGTTAFHLLPYLEEDNLYQVSCQDGWYFALHNDVYAQRVKAFLCPSDPSNGNGVVTDNQGTAWGACSYAGNVQVFCQVDKNGVLTNPEGKPQLTASFQPRGTSNTILIAEKYARCTNKTFPEGGSLWAYWLTNSAIEPLSPAFEAAWTNYSFGPSSKFQTRPTPYRGNCDPVLASTPHPGGMVVGMGDGSVRVLPPDVSGQVWWALCNPKSEEVGVDN
jgi:prepilin-type N-terminal cleavage/methylation domain-containing protein